MAGIKAAAVGKIHFKFFFSSILMSFFRFLPEKREQRTEAARVVGSAANELQHSGFSVLVVPLCLYRCTRTDQLSILQNMQSFTHSTLGDLGKIHRPLCVIAPLVSLSLSGLLAASSLASSLASGTEVVQLSYNCCGTRSLERPR